VAGVAQPVERETTYFREPGGVKLVEARGNAAVVAKKRQQLREEQAKAISKRGKKKSTRDAGEGTAADFGLSDKDQVESLLLTVEALQAQMEDNTRLTTEKEAALTEDRRVREEEMWAVQARDAERLKQLAVKVDHTQDLLYDSTRDYLELKFEHQNHEKSWVEEKGRLLRRIEHLKDDIDSTQTRMATAVADAQRSAYESVDVATELRDAGTNAYRPYGRVDAVSTERGGGGGGGYGGSGSVSSQTTHGKSDRAAAAEARRAESESMAEMYREQCIQLEDELCRLREERTVAKGADSKKAKKLLQRLDLMKQRYQTLETRRTLEAEGYKSSIKILRTRLGEVEAQIYQLASQWSGGDEDLQVLHEVHSTSARSKKVLGELQQLKSRVHEAERSVRNVHGYPISASR
jgi:coiled-coil domain-containing protein 77